MTGCVEGGLNFADILSGLPLVSTLFTRMIDDKYAEIEESLNEVFIQNLSWYQIYSNHTKLQNKLFVQYTSQRGKKCFDVLPTSFVITSREMAGDVFGEGNIPLFVNYNDIFSSNYPKFQTSINF